MTVIRGLKTTKIFVVAAVALMAIVFLSLPVSASSDSEIYQREILDTNISLRNGEYLSSVFETDFLFNLAGFAWQGKGQVKIYLRFYNGQGWSNWYNPESENYFEKEGWYYNTEPILADQSSKIQYSAEVEGEVRAVKLIYIKSYTNNIGEEENSVKPLFSKASSDNELTVISRSEWKADEDWRLNSKGKEIWPTQYQWPEKFVLHHTAGNDGGDNPEGVLRGVYYWHAVVLGWGDIGYNYIIDQEGTIYEGRYGGDGVIAAHVYRDQICARERFGGEEYEADFNKGTIGIAVLGDYENDLTLKEKVKNTLATLIAHKGKGFEIKPRGESYFVDDQYPNIVGHKDLDCTACPGKNLYQELDRIRTEAQRKYESLGGPVDPVIKATYLGKSEESVVINAGEEKEVWVEFRNDGNVTWRSYGKNQPYVVLKDSDSDLRGSDWETDEKVATLATPNVAPGEIGRFVFTLKAPTDRLKASEDFRLSFDDQIEAGTDFSIKVEITGLPYAAELDNRNINQAMFVNDTQTAKMQFRNKGINIWKKGKVKLNIYDLGNKVSQLIDQNWPSDWGGIDFEEAEVKTDELATFNFMLKAPQKLGLYKNIYRLVGEEKIIQEGNFTVTRIDSPYQAELISHNIPLAVLNYWRLPVTVKFRNIGLAPWNRSMVLNLFDLGEEVSKFKDSTWNDQFILKEREVKPGEIGTFKFVLNAPEEKGVYLQILKLGLKDKDTIIQNGEVHLLTRVD